MEAYQISYTWENDAVWGKDRKIFLLATSPEDALNQFNDIKKLMQPFLDPELITNVKVTKLEPGKFYRGQDGNLL